ncbi:MAG: DUF1501 domain-containing protein [bacterium]|nr:DUF1501 domain-containing protein [bacterium]
MKRKEFIGKTVTAGILPVLMNGFSLQAIADSPLIGYLSKAGNEDRVLVLIQLNGGNDGLNTVIPLDQYSNLMAARSNIALAESKVLPLAGTQKTGLHPAMPHMRNLYDAGAVSIIQSVGYPNQDFSHFRSTDIWLTASDSNKYEDTGWMGRYLDTQYPNYPTGYPSATFPDPPAIQIGALISPALQGLEMSFGMSITDPTNFYNFVNGTVDSAPNTPMGHELTFIRLVAQQTQQYSGTIKAAADKANNLSSLYPTKGVNTLADQLKIVARLVAGGLKTKVYMVSLGGFDTHSSQVANTGGTETGVHAVLLGKISEAVNAFQDDLKLLKVNDRVLGMTFSEFGRRIMSNDSLGTDHGAAAPMFVFGTKVNGGIYGNNPVIPSNPSSGDNVAMQYDFRSIYATILKDWFGLSNQDMAGVLYSTFPSLPFINSNATGLVQTEIAGANILTNYPNPAKEQTTIQFTTFGGMVQISLLDLNGKLISALAQGEYGRGKHEISVDTNFLKNGVYLYQLSTEQGTVVNKLIIER